jgi:hypothetical protein
VSARGLAVAAALVAVSGCASTYRARQAPNGDPGWPAAHVDGVRPSDSYQTRGWYYASGEYARLATITRDRGFEVDGYATAVNPDVRWDIRLQGGDGTDVVAMMWSPPTAPRCQGGHPAIAVLLDLDAPPNHPLAPDRQVHWERPVLVRGERIVAGRFDEDPDLLRRESVVDLRLIQHVGGATREVCVRVPVKGPGVTYWDWE